jgi:hypothetical protein
MRTASLNASHQIKLVSTPPAPCLFPVKVHPFLMFSDRTLFAWDVDSAVPGQLPDRVRSPGMFLFESLRDAGSAIPPKNQNYLSPLAPSSLAASSFIVPRTGSSYSHVYVSANFQQHPSLPTFAHPSLRNQTDKKERKSHLLVLSLYSTRYPHSLQRMGSFLVSVTRLSQSPHR